MNFTDNYLDGHRIQDPILLDKNGKEIYLRKLLGLNMCEKQAREIVSKYARLEMESKENNETIATFCGHGSSTNMVRLYFREGILSRYE